MPALGLAAGVLMLPLALTASNWAVRWLQGPLWNKLHQLVYAVALLAVLHEIWAGWAAQHYGWMLLHAAWLAVVLGWRFHAKAHTPPPPTTGLWQGQGVGGQLVQQQRQRQITQRRLRLPLIQAAGRL